MQSRTPQLLAAASAVCLLLVYGAGVYFRAATASLHDDYQPGIEAVRLWVWPGAVLISVVAFAGLTRSALLWLIARWVCVGAVVVCLFLLVFVQVHESSPQRWVFPHERTLGAT